MVSLTPESYRWFAEGAKTWEVRRHGKDFTEREIFPGRKIELRRGHRPEDALKGVIARVAVADDLPSLLDQIPYAAIIPEVGSVDEALAILRRLVGAAARGGLIAFEVALERHGG
jgi:ASC-1-like (ASCH) protein